ncbi:MAG TPA: DUF2815 family protein, partial [Chromatiales bacterium]|nr:DUF2815 family protein [Chromatiales bacterium]
KVRISYPNLFVPRAVTPGSDPRYSCELIVPANHLAIAQIQQAYQKVVQEAFAGSQPTGVFPMYVGEQKYPGDPTYQGMYVIRAAARTKPHVVDQNVQPVMDPGMIYAGCYVNASVTVYAYHQPQKGVTIGLDGIQFVVDGDRLDGRPSAEQLFRSIPGAPPPVAPGPGQMQTPVPPPPEAQTAVPQSPQPASTPAPGAAAPVGPAAGATSAAASPSSVDPVTGRPIDPATGLPIA